MKKILLILFFVLSGCSLNKNNSIATYHKVSGGYEVVMTGKRENMAHDPISFVFRGSSPSQLVIQVPRITGEVNGSEIPVQKGYYKYLGKIHFSVDSMIVNLSYDDYDRKKVYPVSWNGKYTLKER